MQFGTINTVPDGCSVRYTNRVNKPSAHYRPLNCLENSERVYFQALFCSCSALGKPAAFRNRVTLLEQPVIWCSGASSSKHSTLELSIQNFGFLFRVSNSELRQRLPLQSLVAHRTDLGDSNYSNILSAVILASLF